MNAVSKYGLALMLVIAVALMGGLLSLVPASDVTAAPAAVITPVAYDAGSTPARFPIVFFDEEEIAADTVRCFELADYDVMDLHTVIDQTEVNTVTLTVQHTNISGASYVDGSVAVTANAADATAMGQFALFGRWSCLEADVTTTDTVKITAIGVAK